LLNYRKTAIILAVLFIISGWAVTDGKASDDILAVYAGVTIFDNPIYDSLVLLEFPFSINRYELDFFKTDSTDGSVYARVFAQVDLINTSGYVVDSSRTYFSVKAPSRADTQKTDFRIFNKLMLMTKPGIYAARVTVIDASSKKKGDFFIEKIMIAPVVKSKINIGGTCTAYNITYSPEMNTAANQIFNKNGFNVLINPVSIFANTDTVLYLYGEIYNLKYTPDNKYEYRLSLSVLDNQNNLYLPLGSRLRKKSGTSAVVTQDIDIKKYPTGNYKIEMIATDMETDKSDTAYVPFYIISPEEIQLAASQMFQNTGDSYDSLSLDDKIHLVKYLLTPQQESVLSNLSDSGKVNFLYQYWKEHDSDPSTTVIENRLEYIERYRFVNLRFSDNEMKTNGWLTDRGRIYMTYGPWEEIEDIQAPRIGNAYVIWYYHSIKEGKLFVFEDYTGNLDYRLVHSNVYGEKYDQDWQDRIDQGYIDVYED